MTVNSKMTALADEVRTLSGTTDLMGIDAMASTLHTENTNFESNLTEQNDLISQIATLVATKANPQGGITLPTLTSPASASDILNGKEAIDGAGNKITGTIATVTQATPSISINSSGLITASATQTAGYVSAGTKSGTKQMTTKSATTYIPSTSDQTIASGTYLTGTQTIKGDANLKAENIASGVSIFGVSGTHQGGTTEDLDAELTTQESLITQLSSILDSKASGGSDKGNIETCTLEFVNGVGINVVNYTTLDNDGNLIWERIIQPSDPLSLTAVCGTLVQIMCGSDCDMALSNASVVYNVVGSLKVFAINTNINGTATVTLTASAD